MEEASEVGDHAAHSAALNEGAKSGSLNGSGGGWMDSMRRGQRLTGVADALRAQQQERQRSGQEASDSGRHLGAGAAPFLQACPVTAKGSCTREQPLQGSLTAICM